MEYPDVKDSEKHYGTIDQSVYYAVYVPLEAHGDVDPYRHIFKDKQEALCLAKTYKKARFKAFSFYHEAVDFATNGQAHVESAHDGDVKENVQVGEKPVAFRGPKSQDLVKLRKAIENGALTVVETTVWDNPRYLISSGDTPSILQEGSRYNALHVAAKSKNRSMCELLLNTISNINFVTLLYGVDDHQDLCERSKILLDLYLNTPDKGLNETPLHFAVKFGAVEVVELLVSYPQCDKNVPNKFGKLPKQIICERCDTASSKMKTKMAMLLEDAFYVPVLRSEHNCTPPLIGEPFAQNSPPMFNESPLQPQIEIHAYAGPMSKQAAEKFRKVWKTPPRSSKQQSHCKDLEKGLETVGRHLAVKHEVGWNEYWSFLDDFVDITSLDGLQRLENHLALKVLAQFSEDSCTNSNSSLGSNVLSPMSDLCKDLAACQLSENNHRNKHFQAIPKTQSGDNSVTYSLIPDQLLYSDVNPSVCIEKTCEVFAHRISNDILNLLESDYDKSTYELLEIDITQLENVMASFMADTRFNKVDYSYVHHRVGCCTVARLKEFLLVDDEVNFMKKTLELWLEMFSKDNDCFSSDEECVNYRQTVLNRPSNNNNNNKKLASKSKQVTCLLRHIVSELIDDRGFNEDCSTWSEGKRCDCVWPKSSFHKRNTNKHLNRNFGAGREENVSRRLFDSDTDIATPNNSENDCDIFEKRRRLDMQDSGSDSDTDLFFTALNSPYTSDDDGSESDEMFEDSNMPEEDIFIEGCIPTKMDYAVYNAVSCAKEKLNPNDYPNIYKWYHAVSLYPESEKQNWGSSSIARCLVNSQLLTKSTPTSSNKNTAGIQHSPSYTWLRRIGLASPQNSLKLFKPNISFNLDTSQ